MCERLVKDPGPLNNDDLVFLVIGALSFALLVAIAIWERRRKTDANKNKSAKPNSLAQLRGVEYSDVVVLTFLGLCLVPIVLGLAIVCFDYITDGYGNLVASIDNLSIVWGLPVAIAFANILPFGMLYLIVREDIQKHGASRYGSLCRMFIALAVTSIPTIFFAVAATIEVLRSLPGHGTPGVAMAMGVFVFFHLAFVVPIGVVLGWLVCLVLRNL